MTAGQVVRLIIGSVAVIFAAYYTTYFLATRKMKQQSGRAIRVRDRFSLSKDKSICLIDVKDKVYIVAMTNQGATLLDTLDAADFETGDESIGEARQAYSTGIVQKGIAGGLGLIKNGWEAFKGRDAAVDTAAPREYDGAAFSRRPGGAKADELIDLYAGDGTEVLQVAREEDELDAVYRKLQTRRAAGGLKSGPAERGRADE